MPHVTMQKTIYSSKRPRIPINSLYNLKNALRISYNSHLFIIFAR